MSAEESGASLLKAANDFHLAGDFAQAESVYDKLLTQNHSNPHLLATMGTMYLQTQRYGLALSLLHRAVETIPQSDILCNIGIAYKYLGRYEEAHKYFKKACDHKPTAAAFANYSALFVNNGTPDKAIELAKKAFKIDPQNSMAHWNKAMAHLEQGEWADGWDENEWGFDAKMRVRRNIDDKPYWDGTPGKTVAVYGEQGLGDEIMFASMIPDLMKQNEVILECHPRLKTIFEKAFPGIPIYGTRERKEITWQNNHEIDASVSIGSLGKWFRRSRADFPGTPYLQAEAAKKDGFRVGFSWIGGMKPGRVRARSIPLAWWKPILDIPNIEFVSLQYTDCADEIRSLEDRCGYVIKQFDEVKADDYYETAKLVKSCDLVISIATSVYHLAGALGVPTWVLVPSKPAWREQIKGVVPWYRSVRVYRQPESDWLPVVHTVAAHLDELMDNRRQRAA